MEAYRLSLLQSNSSEQQTGLGSQVLVFLFNVNNNNVKHIIMFLSLLEVSSVCAVTRAGSRAEQAVLLITVLKTTTSFSLNNVSLFHFNRMKESECVGRKY